MKISRNPETGLNVRDVNIGKMMEGLKSKEILVHSKLGVNIFERLAPMIKFLDSQHDEELWLYNRRMLTGPSTEVLAMDDNSNIFYGINFASADYLGLAQNESAKEAAILAAKQFGVNSAGSPLAFGATKYYMQLRDELAEYWATPGLLIYSAGWLAGFGVIKGLLSSNDHIIMDQLSHNCLQQGSMATTKNISKFKHLDQAAMTKLVVDTRAKDKDNAILVITEGLFSMDSDSPDLVYYQQVCKENNAFLLIDCAHDFGHLGASGKGVWEVQKLQDRSNVILVGTGSKCLSTNIGFVALPNLKSVECLKYLSTAYMYTNAINPVQAATSLANLRILRSEEGNRLRKKVIENYSYLRGGLQSLGYRILGNPCAILPLFVGNQIVCRLVSRLMMDFGVHVNGIQFPVVSLGQSRLRVSLMPQHTKAHLDEFIATFDKCFKLATGVYEKAMQRYMDAQEENSKL